MFTRNAPQLAFINKFVDAVTVRPFLNDLRRMKQSAAIFRAMPRVDSGPTDVTQAA